MAKKQELLEKSGYGTSTGYGAYNTYGGESYEAHQQEKAHPFATSAGYAYSPEQLKPNQAIQKSQVVLAASALFFLLALALSFTANVQTAQEFGHFEPGAAVSAGICSGLVALLLYGTVGYLMGKRSNTGRMIGMVFALVGIIMGIVSAIVCLVNGGTLLLIAAVCYLLVVLLNVVWLVQTNKPALYNGLRK
ncbi:hypothetical protein [Rothia aerolata]|uniref:Uncharacterized protein n=1 Tax=Rothia aerolata TaxID=1812262 RepID=A0A917IU93_9MICC|nr:hypothetical protein [Rothia aerolata]GGH63816.1 hypothetical protein GCM10007359_15490 [Rothia aerolata]